MTNIFGLFAGDWYRILFGEALRAEHALVEMLLSFAKTSFFMELTSTFNLYAAQTEEHTARLDRIFKTIGQRPQQRPTELSTLLTQARKVIDDYKQQSPALMWLGCSRKMDHKLSDRFLRMVMDYGSK